MHRIERPGRWLIPLLVLMGGCGSSLKGPQLCSTTVGPLPHIYLTGFVARDPFIGHETLIDLTAGNTTLGAPVPANLTLDFDHEATWQVCDQDRRGMHQYRALIGPDPDGGTRTRGVVKTSVATMKILIGWVILAGDMPVSESGLVSTSSEGTQYAIRAQENPVLHTVYNLEPASSPKHVTVCFKTLEACLAPGHHVEVRPDTTVLTPVPTPANDPFVKYVRARAAVANFPLQ